MENFEKNLENLKFLTIFTCLVVKFSFDTKKNFLLKNTFKVSLQYFFNVFITFNTDFNLTLLKLDPKMHIFKNLDEIWKTWKKLEKTIGSPVINLLCKMTSKHVHFKTDDSSILKTNFKRCKAVRKLCDDLCNYPASQLINPINNSFVNSPIYVNVSIVSEINYQLKFRIFFIFQSSQ